MDMAEVYVIIEQIFSRILSILSLYCNVLVQVGKFRSAYETASLTSNISRMETCYKRRVVLSLQSLSDKLCALAYRLETYICFIRDTDHITGAESRESAIRADA